jgi:hypothetical protein
MICLGAGIRLDHVPRAALAEKLQSNFFEEPQNIEVI